MPVTSAAIAALALVVALILAHYGIAKQAHLPLYLVAGLGLTGLLGNVLTRGADALEAATGSLTGFVFGVAVPVALVIVMAISLYAHRANGGGRLASLTALVFFPVCAALGGVFGWLAVNAANLLAQTGPALGTFIASIGGS